MKKIGEFVYIPENNQIRKLCIVETFMDHGAFKFYYKAIDVTPTKEIELRAIKVYDVDACFNNPWYAYYALRKQRPLVFSAHSRRGARQRSHFCPSLQQPPLGD